MAQTQGAALSDQRNVSVSFCFVIVKVGRVFKQLLSNRHVFGLVTVCMYGYVCVCVRVFVWVCVCECVCVRERERDRPSVCVCVYEWSVCV